MRWFFDKMCNILIAIRGVVIFSLMVIGCLCVCLLFFVLYFISRLIPGKRARVLVEKTIIIL